MILLNHKRLIEIFLLAFILRGSAFFLIAPDDQVVLQPDSKMYVSLAEGILQYGRFAYVGSPQTSHVERMPGYPVFLSAIWWVFGQSYLAVIWIQILIDSFSCVLICLIAERFKKNAGWLAGVFAACNLSLITYAFFILNDSLFLFVFLTAIFCITRDGERNGWRLYPVAGFGLGLATLIRPVSMYLPFFLAAFSILFIRRRFQGTWPQALGKTLVMIAGFLVVVAPWAVRNYVQEGRLKLTSQYGEQLLQYVVPSVWEHSRGLPFIEGFKQANQEFEDWAKKEGYNLKMRPFEKADLQTKTALTLLKKEPKSALIKAWAFGFCKNLFAPAIVDFSYLFNVERPHFFGIKGKNALDRAWNFIKGMHGLFAWFFFISLGWMFMIRVLQIWALGRLLGAKPWVGGFLVLIIGYFLFITGPVGYAKYRLPIEPVLIILLSIASVGIYQRWRGQG